MALKKRITELFQLVTAYEEHIIDDRFDSTYCSSREFQIEGGSAILC